MSSSEGPLTLAHFDPRRYHESVAGERTEVAERPPVCLYLEVTNRCNLLCTTCPRTYEELEPPADMSWDLFVSIVDQVEGLGRARSEEHTSELQSLRHLVCRLLLEKKK